jgi:hypothetical protein
MTPDASAEGRPPFAVAAPVPAVVFVGITRTDRGGSGSWIVSTAEVTGATNAGAWPSQRVSVGSPGQLTGHIRVSFGVVVVVLAAVLASASAFLARASALLPTRHVPPVGGGPLADSPRQLNIL